MLLRSASAESMRAPAISFGAAATPAGSAIASLLARFSPISLDEMDAVALQNRTDTKYVLSETQLYEALGAVAGHYRVLEIGGARLSGYQTLYFDTPDLALYLQHHAGKGNRYKVRSRRYVGTGQSFLEVKLKSNKERTVKRRVPTETFTAAPASEVGAFLSAQLGVEAPTLAPALWNAFSRVTLVSRTARERVTVDLSLRYGSDGKRRALPDIAVVEVKQDGVDRGSALIQQLHAAHIQPTGFSKYCIGVSLLYPHVKHNRFKPKLRLIDRLIGDSGHDD